jgi:hypothetical protein
MRSVIKFKQAYHVYAPGDTATFERSTAEVLVRQGFADHVRDVAGPEGTKVIHPDSTRGMGWTKDAARGPAKPVPAVAKGTTTTKPPSMAPQLPAAPKRKRSGGKKR